MCLLLDLLFLRVKPFSCYIQIFSMFVPYPATVIVFILLICRNCSLHIFCQTILVILCAANEYLVSSMAKWISAWTGMPGSTFKPQVGHLQNRSSSAEGTLVSESSTHSESNATYGTYNLPSINQQANKSWG